METGISAYTPSAHFHLKSFSFPYYPATICYGLRISTKIILTFGWNHHLACRVTLCSKRTTVTMQPSQPSCYFGPNSYISTAVKHPQSTLFPLYNIRGFMTQQTKVQFCILQPFRFRRGDDKTKVSELNSSNLSPNLSCFYFLRD